VKFTKNENPKKLTQIADHSKNNLKSTLTHSLHKQTMTIQNKNFISDSLKPINKSNYHIKIIQTNLAFKKTL
jgi:hypothetical protein